MEGKKTKQNKTTTFKIGLPYLNWERKNIETHGLKPKKSGAKGIQYYVWGSWYGVHWEHRIVCDDSLYQWAYIHDNIVS